MSDEIQRIDNNSDHKREKWEIAKAAMSDCDNISSIIINYVTPSSTVTEVVTSSSNGVHPMDSIAACPIEPKQLKSGSEQCVSVKDVSSSVAILDSDGDGVPDAIDNNRVKTPIAEVDDKSKKSDKLKHFSTAPVLSHDLFGKDGLFSEIAAATSTATPKQSQVGYIFDPMQNKGAGDEVKGVGAIDN